MQKLEALKAELNDPALTDPAKKLELIEAHKAQKKKVKRIKKALRENYVKRGMVKKIIAAWIITVPAAAVLSAIIFYIIKGVAV